jgi:iron complex outermembrane receptor protein
MKTSKRRTLFKCVFTLLLALGMALVCGPAMGQNEDETAGQDASDEEEFLLEEIVVTGSRIPRRDYESYSPIVTIKADTFLDRSNIGLESTLNQMPQFLPAGTQTMFSDASTPLPSATAAPGAATANLRGLGTNRTLVLVDGKRVQPMNAALVVDLNTIPAAAVESVEVITGGAAAVYGADAIAGVVNLILKKDFQGATFDAQYGITEEGDGEEFQFSALLGAEIGDGRGNVMMGFNYADRGNIQGKDREFIRDGWNDPGTVSAGIQSLGTSTLIGFNPGTVYVPTAWSAASYRIDQNGNVFDPTDPFNTDHPYTGPISYESGFKISSETGELTYFNKDINYLQLPLERYSIFGSGRYSLTDTIEFYMDLRYSENRAIAIANQQQFFNIWAISVPYNQQYDDPDSPDFGQAPYGVAQHPVPAGLADLLNSRVFVPSPFNPFPDPAFDPLTWPWLLEQSMHYLPPYQTDTTSNVYQVSGGVRGEFGSGFTDDWTWDLYYSHGKSTISVEQLEGFTNLQRSQEIFEADQYGKGFSAGYVISVIHSCESGIPVFNEDGSVNTSSTVSQDCADYMTLRMNHITELEQNVFEANMQGSLFELPWSGAIQFALGADYREEIFRFNPDSGFNANQSFPDVVGNIALPVAVNGSTDVSELYAELLIPVVKDLPLIKSFTLEPGYRISDYSIAEGKVDTYKVMADWRVTDWVRLRGGQQRANRAPNIAELFMPTGASDIVFGQDGCNNDSTVPNWGNKPENPNRYNLQVLCQYLMVRDGAPENFSLYVPGESANDYHYYVFGPGYWAWSLAITGGNPDLESETADTQTLGIVIDSPFSAPPVKNLRLSIDYYDIEIDGAIAAPTHDLVYQQCMDAQYNPLIGSAPGTYTGEELAAGNPYCALINREFMGDGMNDYGADRNFDAVYFNMGAIYSEGYDVQIDWSSDFSDIGLDAIPGRLGVNVLYSKLEKYAQLPFKGGEIVEYTGTTVNSSFDYQMLTTFTYSNGGFSGGLRWMHLPSLDPAPSSASDIQGVNSYDEFDLFARYLITDNMELRGGINNLFYAKPEPVGASSTDNNLGTFISSHDVIGRRFYVAARYWF